MNPINAQGLGASADFRWLSPLGISVILFSLQGALYILVALFSPFVSHLEAGRQLLIISPRTDAQLFGQQPEQLLESDSSVNTLRSILYIIMGGFMFAAGFFHLTLTWFGLRQGHPWALIALAVGGLLVLPFWYLALRYYLDAGVNVRFSDLPPFMWIPAVLLTPATILGWIGLR